MKVPDFFEVSEGMMSLLASQFGDWTSWGICEVFDKPVNPSSHRISLIIEGPGEVVVAQNVMLDSSPSKVVYELFKELPLHSKTFAFKEFTDKLVEKEKQFCTSHDHQLRYKDSTGVLIEKS